MKNNNIGGPKQLIAYLVVLIIVIYIGIFYSIQHNPGLVNLLSALLTPTIAFAGIVIGVLQWKINQNRLKHELFPRRIELFEKITLYIANIVCQGNVKEGDETQFLRNTKHSYFIFGKDIEEYVDSIYTKSIELQILERLLISLAGAEKEDNFRKQKIIKKWFQDELNSIRPKFDKYLTLNF